MYRISGRFKFLVAACFSFPAQHPGQAEEWSVGDACCAQKSSGVGLWHSARILGSWAALSCPKNTTFEECFLGHKVYSYSGHI